MAPRAKAKTGADEEQAAADASSPAIPPSTEAVVIGGTQILPNNNPALTVAVLGDAPTFLPIIGWSIGEGAPVAITPYGEQPLDDSHVLHDNAQRKYLVGGKWVKEP